MSRPTPETDAPDRELHNLMKFKIGKYYQHGTGRVISIIGTANTFFHGSCLLAEEEDGRLMPVGEDEDAAQYWHEVSGWKRSCCDCNNIPDPIESTPQESNSREMSEQEIKSNLCYYDPKNPNKNLNTYEDEDRPQPREKCYCDNCFYGRDKLAMQLLEVIHELREAREDVMELQDIKRKHDQLKRERDEAHSILEQVTDRLEQATIELIKLQSQRDEARELLKETSWYVTAINGLCEHLKIRPVNTTLLAVEVLKIECELNSIRAKFVAALDGRDMANKEAEKLREQNAKLRDIAERAMLFCDMRMRDSLRAELEQLKEGAKCPVCTPEQKCWECADDTSLKEGKK